MPYPTSYRRRPRSSPQQSAGNFWRDESGFLRFPDRGTWANPTRPTGDYTPPPRPFVRPPAPTPLIPPDPATRPQQDIPWWERRNMSRSGVSRFAGRAFGLGSVLLSLSEMLWPGEQYRFPWVPPPQGMTHVCGPTGWPGPPYMRSVRVFFQNFTVNTPVCGLGGQSVAGYTVFPGPSTRSVIYFWGPNALLLPAERYFVDDQYTSVPAVGVLPALRFYPALISSQAAPLLPPGVSVEVMPDPQPLYQVPATQGGPSPWTTTRGNTETDTATLAQPVVATSPSPGGLSYQPDYPEVRPRPRERERKTAPGAGAAFKFFSQVGTWHSFVNALHQSLPPKYSHRRRTLQQKLQDIYQHYDEIDLDRAARKLFQYWLQYKAAGWAYGRVQKHLVEILGPRDGNNLYRWLIGSENLV